MDRKTRKLLAMLGFHPPKADTVRLYLPRSRVGLECIELNTAYKTRIVDLSNYIKQGNDNNTRMLAGLKRAKGKYSLLKINKAVEKKYRTARTTNLTQLKVQLKASITKEQTNILSKPLHSQFFSDLNKKLLDHEKAFG